MQTLHSKPILGCKVKGGLVLTCSLDKTARITNIETNNLVHMYNPAPVCTSTEDLGSVEQC